MYLYEIYFLLSKIWKSTGFLNHKISFIPQYNLQQLHAKAWWFYNPQNVLSYLPSSHAMIGSRSGSWVIAQCFHLASRSAVLSFCLTKTRKISCSSISILCLYRDLLKIKIFSAKIGLWFHESYSDIITKLPKLFKLLSEQFIKLKFQSRDGLGAGKQVHVLLIYLYVFFYVLLVMSLKLYHYLMRHGTLTCYCSVHTPPIRNIKTCLRFKPFSVITFQILWF